MYNPRTTLCGGWQMGTSIQQAMYQCTTVMPPRRVDNHTRRLTDNQDLVILMKNREIDWLRNKNMWLRGRYYDEDSIVLSQAMTGFDVLTVDQYMAGTDQLIQ